jgi:hypothetical protein
MNENEYAAEESCEKHRDGRKRHRASGRFHHMEALSNITGQADLVGPLGRLPGGMSVSE